MFALGDDGYVPPSNACFSMLTSKWALSDVNISDGNICIWLDESQVAGC